jgi:hypothetical protein
MHDDISCETRVNWLLCFAQVEMTFRKDLGDEKQAAPSMAAAAAAPVTAMAAVASSGRRYRGLPVCA